MQSRFTAFISVAICATGAFGQNSVSTNSGPNGFAGTAQFGPPPPFIGRSVVTGAPYSGEEVSEQIQTLADGTHISRKQPSTKVYRDSMGRTRTERPMFNGMSVGGQASEAAGFVEIIDPVAQVRYTLDGFNKVAHRQQLPTAAERTGGVGGGVGMGTGMSRSGVFTSSISSTGAVGVLSQGPPFAAVPSEGTRPQMANEDLGTQTIEGVLARGTRHTTTWPIGSQGNDRPIVVVSETWMSPDLKVMILSKSNDPRSGEHTQKLTNISLGEPSASLFQPPPEYTVVDEKGAFTIKWGAQ